jgi:hypothetical protein
MCAPGIQRSLTGYPHHLNPQQYQYEGIYGRAIALPEKVGQLCSNWEDSRVSYTNDDYISYYTEPQVTDNRYGNSYGYVGYP